jgi:hypothetical protein
MAGVPVDPLSVTAAWLSKVLGADVRQCRLEQMGIGVGLLGRLYRAHLEGGPDVPTSVVVKLPVLDGRVRSEICEDLEFDRAFGELSGPDFRLENRSRSGFGDRSATELRATYEDLTAMVASARIWHSALCWLSPTLAVGRFERDAVGRDGERYAWTLIDVAEIRDGQVALTCQFELDGEEAAFAYAEECMRAADAQPRPHS